VASSWFSLYSTLLVVFWVVDLVMRWLGLSLVITYFPCVDLVLLHSLVLCDLCHFSAIMVFLLVPWSLVIGRHGILIMQGAVWWGKGTQSVPRFGEGEIQVKAYCGVTGLQNLLRVFKINLLQ